MNSYTEKTKENTGQSVANTFSQKKSGGESTFQFEDNRPEGIAQRKLQEMASNKRQVMKFGLGPKNVIQARFDDQDIDKMREVVRGDQTLTNILNEVFAIHNQMPDDINYGISSKGGHAALNEEGMGQVVVKDERWALTKKIKNFFNAYGMEHDVERQSMIIHELTFGRAICKPTI